MEVSRFYQPAEGVMRTRSLADPEHDQYVIPYGLVLSTEVAMPKLKPSRDIQPVTEFRAKAAQFIEQVQETGEPVILTQHGRSAAVLLDVESYESMMDELALLRDVRTAEEQIAAGRSRSHTAVAKTLRARLRR